VCWKREIKAPAQKWFVSKSIYDFIKNGLKISHRLYKSGTFSKGRIFAQFGHTRFVEQNIDSARRPQIKLNNPPFFICFGLTERDSLSQVCRRKWKLARKLCQGDQIGRIFAFWVIVYYGQFCENDISSPNFWASFINGKRYWLVLAYYCRQKKLARKL
jgi:hypothetical protein